MVDIEETDAAGQALAQTARIDDFITLFCDDGPGFVFSRVTSSAHAKWAVARQGDKDVQHSNLPDLHAATFQVIGATKFKAVKSLRKVQGKLKKKSPEEYTPDEHKVVAKEMQRARIEIEDNRQERARQSGKPIVYGQIIQLHHALSRRFLAVSTTQTSSLEPSNMQLDLTEDSSRKSQFRVLPRYKVRSVGDQVRVGDQIQLESVKTEGQFLHCSKSNFDSQYVESSCRELNLSATQSALTVLMQFSPFGKIDVESMLRGGSVIRLFHRELEAYLTAEGAFYMDELVQDVHLRVRPQVPERPRSLEPPSSAITYWQVELDENPTSGALVSWGQRIRLKHMGTRKYLGLVTLDVEPGGREKYQLTLSNCETKTERLQSAFRLHPVIQEDGAVKMESYCRIDHPRSRQWLHALPDTVKGHEFQRKEASTLVEGGSMSLAGLLWDKAKLRRIHVSDEMNYNDAFTLQEVSPDLIAKFNLVAGMLPIFKAFRDNLKSGVQLNAKVSDKFKKCLEQLSEFQVVNGEPVKDCQKLLRNLQVVDVMVEILKMHGQSYIIQAGGKDHLADVCCKIYVCLETYLLGNSRKNELYAAKYIPFFQSQIGQGLNAETMAMELARDNRDIIDRLPRSQMDSFVDLLLRKKDGRYLDFLGVLCECDGIAIPENQVYICQKLLEEHKDSKIVYLTEPTKDKKSMEVSVDGGVSWKPLAKFAAKGGDDEQNPYEYLEHQLDLFGKMCYGRNEYVIDVITKKLRYLTWTEVFICLKDGTLPDHLRAKYCELIVGMFVDVSPNYSALETLELSFIFNEVREEPAGDSIQVADTSITGARLEFFPDLRKWIAGFMSKNTDMTASNIGDNELIGEVFRLLYYLVSFGYYSAACDIEELLKPLMGVLDGTNDKPFDKARGDPLKEYRETGRFQPSPQNKAVVDAKFRAMEVLDVFFNFGFNVRLESLIYEFKSTVESMNREGGSPNTTAFRHLQGKIKGGLSSVRVRGNIDPKYSVDAPADSSDTIISVLMSKVSDEAIFSGDALDYARYRLQEHVFKKVRLFKGTNMEKILLDLAEYKYDKMVVKSMYLLDRYYSTHATLFDKAIQGQVLITDSSIEVFKRVRRLVPELRRLTTAKLTREMEARMSEIISIFSDYCTLVRRTNGEKTDEPHPMNQRILLNFGVVDDIFNVLDKRIDVKLIDTQYAGLRAIFQKCFCFLQVMARDNAPVQEKIFERMDRLLEVPGAPQELGFCIAEVFTGNQTLCLGIKPEQVKRIVELVAAHREKGSELLEALNAIVKVEELDLPLKRNQAAVITYINQNRTRVAWIVEPEMRAERMSLLHDGREENELLAYLVKLVDVLATCAEGENRFIESMCQNIFTLNEIIEVLNDSAVPIWCKRPYLRFFVWCYLNTAGGKIESGCGDLDHDDAMWQFMTSSRDALKSLCSGFNSFSRSRAADLRQTFQKRRNTASAKSLRGRPKQQGKEVTLSTHGVLQYLFEGLLPFLQVFYTEFFSPDRKLKTYDREVKVSQLIAIPLLTLYESMTSVVTNLNHYSLLKTTIATIIGYTEVVVPDDLVTKFQQDAFKVNPDLRSDAQKEYTEDFFEEEELNNKLNLFVANFETAYEGRNTLREQINEPYDAEYCEDGGDEDLPRGREFQRFLHLFQDGDGISGQHVSKLIGHIYISFHSHEYRDVSSVQRVALDTVNIKSLQLLRALIHNKVVTRAALELSGGTSAAIQRYDVMIDSIQRAVNSHGTTEKVVPMLSHANDEVVRETLALLSLLLFNAQVEVQTSFQEYFLNTREEQFFRDIELRLQRSTVALRERRALRSQFQAKQEKDKKLAETVRARPTTAGKTAGKTMLRPGQARNEFEMQEIMREVEQDVAPEVSEDGINVTKDDGYIELVLRIAGGLCNGQQRTIQNYLREQRDNIKSINLVAATVDYLQLFKDDVNPDNVELVVQIIQTLVEYTGGNTDNQACVFDSQLIEALNSIMRTDWKNIAMTVAVMAPVTDLLRNLVELSVPATKALAQLVGDTIHYESLYMCLDEVYKHRSDPDSMANVVGYRIVHFLMRVNDFAPKGRKWTDMPDFEAAQNRLNAPNWIVAWKHYCRATLSVEVVHADALQRVYFAAEFQDDLRPEVKEQLKWNIQRDSAANKLRDFLKWSDDIREDMEYQGQLTRNRIASFFVKNSWYWAFAMLMLTYIINIFMVATWQAPVFYYDILPETPSYYNIVIYILGSIHLFFSLCVMISFFIANLKNFTIPGPINSVVYKFTNHSFNGDSDIEKHNQLGIIGMASIYHVCLVGFSAASIPLKGYFFCFHLLHIVVNNDTLTRVLQSVTRPGRQLIYVTILAVFIIYIYSVASFGLLRIFFDRDEGLFCENLGQCYATSIRFGLLSTLGDVIPGHNYDYKDVGLRIIFDLTFFVIITTIGLNIVFGLIVDSFSALRDEKNDALEDMTSTCFMCSVSSHEFEKHAKGFDHHVKQDHNMWAYLFYFIYLHKVEVNDMTATEDFVYRKVRAQDIDFFPTNQALCLENVEVGNEEQLDQLKDMVARLVQRIEREEDEERRKKARDEQRQWEKRARRSMDGDRRASSATVSMDGADRRASAVRMADDIMEEDEDDE